MKRFHVNEIKKSHNRLFHQRFYHYNNSGMKERMKIIEKIIKKIMEKIMKKIMKKIIKKIMRSWYRK